MGAIKEGSLKELHCGGIVQGGKLEIRIFYILNKGGIFEGGAYRGISRGDKKAYVP